MLKSFLRSITPPLIWEGSRRIKRAARPLAPVPPPPPPVTEILFPSWEAAKMAAGSYEDAALTDFRAARYGLNLAANKLPALESKPIYWLRQMLGADLSITDFGGSFGEYGTRFLQSFPGSKYTVTESPSMVAAANRFPNTVQFTTEMPEACDVFYTGGTLQYLDDPYGIARQGLRSASRAVVFSRNCFCPYEMFRVQQSMLFENGIDAIPEGFENTVVSYPIRMLSEEKIDSIAINLGFKRLLRLPAAQTFPHRDVYNVLLVYMK